MRSSPLTVHATRRVVMDVEHVEVQHHQRCLTGKDKTNERVQYACILFIGIVYFIQFHLFYTECDKHVTHLPGTCYAPRVGAVSPRFHPLSPPGIGIHIAGARGVTTRNRAMLYRGIVGKLHVA